VDFAAHGVRVHCAMPYRPRAQSEVVKNARGFVISGRSPACYS
jgi:hypothetical protein